MWAHSPTRSCCLLYWKVQCSPHFEALAEKAVWLSTWNCEIFSNFQTFSSQRICKKCIFTLFIASIASQALAHLAAGIQPPKRKRKHSLQESITPAANFLPLHKLKILESPWSFDWFSCFVSIWKLRMTDEQLFYGFEFEFQIYISFPQLEMVKDYQNKELSWEAFQF